jgi:16S rRNA (uracil1498-N3)-methyltransferase
VIQTFLANEVSVTGNVLTVSDDRFVRHAKAARIRTGEELRVITQAKVYIVKAASVHPKFEASVESAAPNDYAPYPVHIFTGILSPKSENEDVVAAVTQMGAASYTPLITSRVQRKSGKPIFPTPERIESAARTACELSGRGRLPMLRNATTLDDACKYMRRHSGFGAGPAVVLFYEDSAQCDLSVADMIAIAKGAASIMGLIGPEGGFTPEEVALARAAGAKIVSLGDLVMEARVAATVACAHLIAAMER